MAKIERIILDLDDVLNTFTIDCLQYFGAPISSYEDYPVECAFNIRAALSQLTRKPEMGLVEFWERVPREVWSYSRPTTYLYDLLDFCTSKVGQNILIATSPTKCPECMAGKYEWIEKYLPRWMHRQFAITPRKWWFDRYDTLLIDDSEDNCSKMQNAIALPRPWNRNWGRDVMTCIREEYEEIQ